MSDNNRSQPPAEATENTTTTSKVSNEDLNKLLKTNMNAQIAHEIRANPNFQIPYDDPQQDNPMYKMVRDTVERAFWDKLRDDLTQQPPQYQHAFKIIEEIKQMLMELAGLKRNHFHSQIEETLDFELFQQQAEAETFDIAEVAAFIISIMAKTCAPARDDQIRSLQQIEDLAQLFKQIFAVLHLMNKDMTNTLIKAYRPLIGQRCVQTERENFAAVLQKVPDIMKKTTVWLRDALKNSLKPNVVVRPAMIYRQAYQSLLEVEYRRLSEIFPETLVADAERIFVHKNRLEQLNMVVAVYLSSQGFFDKNVRDDKVLWNNVKTELMSIIKSQTVDTEERIKSNVKSLFTHVATLTRGKVRESDQLETRLSEHADRFCPIKNQPVYKLIRSRALAYVSDVTDTLRIGSSSSEHDVVKRVPVPSGFGDFELELKELAVSFAKIVNFHHEVFHPFHHPIIVELFNEQGLEL